VSNTTFTKARIAVMINFDHCMHTYVAVLLRNVLSSSGSGSFIISMVNVPFDSQKIKDKAADVVRQKYDCVVTIGDIISFAAKQVFDEHGGFPQLFLGVQEPLELSGGYSSGIALPQKNVLAPLQKCMRFAPFRRKILLPYVRMQETSFIDRQVRECKVYAGKNAEISLHVAEIESPQLLIPFLNDHKNRFDSVLILEGCASESEVKALAEWCWRHEVVLCAPQAPAIGLGAASAYGNSLDMLIAPTVAMIELFCLEGLGFGQQPLVTKEEERRFIINKDMLRRIGLQKHEVDHFCNHDDVEVVCEQV
jgi:hypothetical protein